MNEYTTLFDQKKLGGPNINKVGGPKNWVGQTLNWVDQSSAGLPVAPPLLNIYQQFR